MALVNHVTRFNTTHSTSGGSDATYGYDESFTTYHVDVQSRTGSGDFSLSSTLVSEHTFIVVRSITTIKYHLYTKNDADGNYPNGSGSWKVEVKQSESWSTVASGSCGEGVTLNTGAVTDTTGWTSVEAVRATVTATSGGDANGSLETRIYEIQAFGVWLSKYSGVV